jgi:hypothetical protein
MKKYNLFHLYIFTTILLIELIELYHFNIGNFSPYPMIEILDPPLPFTILKHAAAPSELHHSTLNICFYRMTEQSFWKLNQTIVQNTNRLQAEVQTKSCT